MQRKDQALCGFHSPVTWKVSKALYTLHCHALGTRTWREGAAAMRSQVHGSLSCWVISGHHSGALCAFATALTTPGSKFSVLDL